MGWPEGNLFVEELYKELAHGRKIERPEFTDRFILLNFNSSQYGYLDIRSGDFYEMGQN
jgi:hypothetical protein